LRVPKPIAGKHPGSLCPLYETAAPFVWNPYAAPAILTAATGPRPADGRILQIGAVMNDHSQRDNASPYSALPCLLLLLTTGIGVKFGAAIHVCHLAQGAC
jgi:hypothetical protein